MRGVSYTSASGLLRESDWGQTVVPVHSQGSHNYRHTDSQIYYLVFSIYLVVTSILQLFIVRFIILIYFSWFGIIMMNIYLTLQL